jgi:hypothetical protein
VCHHPHHLSLRTWNFAKQRRASNAADRHAKSGNTNVVARSDFRDEATFRNLEIASRM